MIYKLSFVWYRAGCESEGYCRFPPFLWQPIQGGSGPGAGASYRKWYSRTEYTRNTQTWTRQKEVHAHETEIAIYQRFYASCTGYGDPGEMPCFRQTKKTRFICVAEEPDGKFRVQQLSTGWVRTVRGIVIARVLRQGAYLIEKLIT